MGQLVVPVVNIDEGIRPVAELIGEDKRANARDVGRKCQDQQVAHHPQMLGVFARNSRRRRKLLWKF